MSQACSLCGLACGPNPARARLAGEERAFCCFGCLNVYNILVESGALAPGADPRETDLFRRSLQMGLVSNAGAGNAPAIPEDAETRDAVFQVDGMWCASCAWLIERALKNERGVRSAEVLFASDLVKVRYCPQYLPPDRIASRIASLGYRAEPYTGADSASLSDRTRRDLLLRTGVAAFLWMNVMLFSLVTYAAYWEAIADSARRFIPVILMGLSAPAVFWSAWPVLRLAALGLRERVLRMDALLALGIVAAWGYSAAEAFLGGRHYYFDTSCAIVTLVLAGKLMEHGAKQRTSKSIAFLHRMMPRKARVFDEAGREKFVSIEALLPGMSFLVKAGERIPGDGLVEEGESHADESVLTGESTPVPKRPGDSVACGALNAGGVLRIRATRGSADSTLTQMIRSVEAALGSRSAIERTVDRWSRVFVPFVIAVAVATLGGWRLAGLGWGPALVRAISVLVIACPCALGIATPLALTAAVGRASRRGVLINDVRVLETVRDVDVLVLDKTGTVTAGDFSLLESSPGAEEHLAVVASLERYSEHPLGRAVLRRAEQEGLALQPATGIEVVKGAGIRGTIAGLRVFAGSARMAEPDADLAALAREWEADGRSVAYFGWDGTTRGALAFGDRLRDSAKPLARALAERGVRTMLVSGDSQATVASVARALGIAEYRAEVLPSGKADVIAELQAGGARVAMAGDGVNDAPALARADLGIAMGTGADLSMNAAPMVLMGAALDRIPEIFDLSRRTFRAVRQNLFWAFFYNTLGITLAITGVLNPILGAAAMVLSSLSVILNSSRVGRDG